MQGLRGRYSRLYKHGIILPCLRTGALAVEKKEKQNLVAAVGASSVKNSFVVTERGDGFRITDKGPTRPTAVYGSARKRRSVNGTGLDGNASTAQPPQKTVTRFGCGAMSAGGNITAKGTLKVPGITGSLLSCCLALATDGYAADPAVRRGVGNC